jgi:hypothetical protein
MSPSFAEPKPKLLKRWKNDLGRFTSLRASVSLRYAKRVDWSARAVGGCWTSFATVKRATLAIASMMRGQEIGETRNRRCRSAGFFSFVIVCPTRAPQGPPIRTFGFTKRKSRLPLPMYDGSIGRSTARFLLNQRACWPRPPDCSRSGVRPS